MNVSDLIVEVRDRDLVRVAQFTEADLAGLTFVIRANTVGAWGVSLPATILDASGARIANPVAEALRAEGAGVIIQTSAGTVLSGPMTEAKFDATADDADGVWTITGVSDAILLADALAFPQPSNANPATQTAANDTRTANAEDLLRTFVSANIGPTAPAGRRTGFRSLLTIAGSSLGRGPTLTFSPRFANLLELCQSIAVQGGLQFDVLQVGAALQFVVTEPADRSDFVQMDVENEQLASVSFGFGSPSTTVAVVAGQGEGTGREIVQVTSTESLSAESTWGRRIERFVDQRQAELTAELTQAGEEVVSAAGSTVASVKASPSEDLADSFMVDWRVGDFVTIVVRDAPLVVPVVEAAVRVSEQGVLVGATLGDPTGFDPEDLAFTRQERTEARVSALERNAEPPTWGTLDGKPSTFTPAAHTHAAGDITSGTFAIERIPTGTSGTTVALGNHNHDSRYYTEAEIDALLAARQRHRSVYGSFSTSTYDAGVGNSGSVWWGEKTVSFGVTFAEVPTIAVYALTTGAVMACTVIQASTTGFTFRAIRFQAALSGTFTYAWSATGRLT